VLIGSGLVVLLVLLGAGALVLLLVGLSGRLVRTPPLCGRCRFDLSGHGPGPERPQVTCPECGLRITNPSQVVRFRRERRGWCLRAALAAGVLSVGGITAVVAGTGGTLDGYRLLPTDRLIAMAEGGSAGAFDALRVRVEADQLDDAQWRRVADHAVAQAVSSGRDRRRVYGQSAGVSWTSFYGDALRRGVIDRATAESHAARMVNLRLELPEPVRAGEPLPMRVSGRLRLDPGFDGWSSSPGLDARVVGVRLNGRELLAPNAELSDPEEGEHDFAYNRPTMEASWTWEGTEDLPVLDGVMPGENTVEVVVRLSSPFTVGGGGAAMVSHVVQPGSPLPWLDVTLSKTLPIGERDPSHTAAVAEWEAASAVQTTLSRRCDCGRAPGVRLRLDPRAGLLDNAVGFVDVYLAVGDAEPWYLGNERITAGDSWSEVILTDEQAALIDQHAGATLRLVPTPWNADLYFDRSRPVVGGADVSRPVVFEDEEADQDE
jgi:hypothetical protein